MNKKLLLLIVTIILPLKLFAIVWSQHYDMAMEDMDINSTIEDSQSSLEEALDEISELLDEWNKDRENYGKSIEDKKFYDEMIELEKTGNAKKTQILDLIKYSNDLDEKLIELEAQ